MPSAARELSTLTCLILDRAFRRPVWFTVTRHTWGSAFRRPHREPKVSHSNIMHSITRVLLFARESEPLGVRCNILCNLFPGSCSTTLQTCSGALRLLVCGTVMSAGHSLQPSNSSVARASTSAGPRASVVDQTMDPSKPPRSLAGPDWLWTQGARSEDRRERATGSASSNQELGQVMRGVAERTRVEASAEGAAVWQHELRQYGHALQKPMNFQPTRMMFYCEGRPIVVQWTLSLFWCGPAL